MTVAGYMLFALIACLALLTVLPVSRLPHGAIRVADFPRIQVLCLALAALVAAQFFLAGPALVTAAAILIGVVVAQGWHVLRFTPAWRSQSVRADPLQAGDEGRQISIMSSNVKKSNRDFGRLLDVVARTDPDIVILLEVDQDWLEGVAALRQAYTQAVEHPLDNGYGMAVYSRLPFFETELRELLVTGVPSLKTGVRLRSGERLRLYVLHPEPPVPTLGTEGRDGEIGLVGLEVSRDTLPAIVTGDLNDVAWSATTRRFQRISRLLDPRVGRGLFNTFDARIPLIRWPLDHLFHDARFRLIDMRRLPDIGSDHFPIWFRLVITGTQAAEEMPALAEDAEIAEIEEVVKVERDRSREPIGGDWEDER